jgi:hypothetical protein
MNLFKRFYFPVLGVVLLGFLGMGNSVKAVSYYGLSCTNLAYGTQLIGTDGAIGYAQAYTGLAISFSAVSKIGTRTSDSAATTGSGSYLGVNCLYSGAGLTNSSAIVSGDVARTAANAIVNAVNGRLMAAMAQNEDTAAHMSYTSNSNGVGMAANRLIGGLSVWTNYTSSDFDNDQNFVRKSTDSNNYDGDSSALSIGIDKKVGNLVVGLVGTSYDTDLDIEANAGTYAADGETYGVYAGLNTGVLMLMAGYGVGSYDVDTERLDLGTGTTTITGTTEADINYYHIAAAAKLQRGNFTFVPRVAYRDFDLDTDAFTDVVPNDSNFAGPSDNNTTGTNSAGKNTADVSIASFSASSTMTEVGLNAAVGLRGGAIMPFIDVAYVSEDTTSASYQTELKTDDVAETAATDADGYTSAGLGINFGLRNRLTGSISYYETFDRDDYNESTMSATIRLNF